MKSDLGIIFNFIISQWSLSPQAFKEAIVSAAAAKFTLSIIWWATRFLVGKFPKSGAVSFASRMLGTKPAKLVVVVVDVTLIDVFLFFAVVATRDVHLQFSYFSLWSAALFAFLFIYMLIITHADIKRY
ncbi:MAG: hypothetical protein WBM28_00300 [Burkholderiales bacterium]